jgi:filamentous hemagglutinin
MGEPFEWDIQLSNKGKKQLGWASKSGKHINVSLKGTSLIKDCQ